ncbi:hypothetical protein [Tetragenococcus halophilus]|uniref:hypothetical protein n=1 Tax=Tetragenococcus halophilus TaxID=51669 RepID=UPI0030E88371
MIEKYHGVLVSILEREKLGLLSKDYIRDTVNLILKEISILSSDTSTGFLEQDFVLA